MHGSQVRTSQPIEKHTIVGVLVAPSQVVYSDVVASMERLEQVVRQRLGDYVQDIWKWMHVVCVQKTCPKILRDHIAVEVSSIDSLEKQRRTVEKVLQANVHGSERRPWMSMPLPRPREARKAARGKTREASQRSLKVTVSGVARMVT